VGVALASLILSVMLLITRSSRRDCHYPNHRQIEGRGSQKDDEDTFSRYFTWHDKKNSNGMPIATQYHHSRPVIPQEVSRPEGCPQAAPRVSKRRCMMNWDQIAGNWKQFTGKVKEKWGKLTDDDLTSIAGKRDQLAGKLRERYGYEKDQAEKELDSFLHDMKS
jgi:uncharacterized protein YjbJ (UPF0337 family)